VATSWVPAIENLGHMKGFVSEHYLGLNDHISGVGDADPAVFTKRLQELDSQLAKATEVYAATLLTHTTERGFRRCRKGTVRHLPEQA